MRYADGFCLVTTYDALRQQSLYCLRNASYPAANEENLWDAKGGTFGVTGIPETGEVNHRKKRLIPKSTASSLEEKASLMGFLIDNQNPTLFCYDKNFPGGSVGELVRPKGSEQFLIWNEEKRIVLSLRGGTRRGRAGIPLSRLFG